MTDEPHEPEGLVQLDLTSLLFLPSRTLRDRDGNYVSLEQWVKLIMDLEYARIGCWSNDVVTISTIWLGAEMSSTAMSHPFETMVFARGAADGASWDCLRWRWQTAKEARQGHAHIVEAVQERGVAALEDEDRHRKHQWDALFALLHQTGETEAKADAAQYLEYPSP